MSIKGVIYMRIVKYPKPPKRLKYKDICLSIRVKCEDCGTIFHIENIDDFILDTGLLFWCNPKIPVFFTSCPYCGSRYIPLSYWKCKRIYKWAKNVGCSYFHERKLRIGEEFDWRI